GMHVLDIGAHIGVFSVCAEQLVGSDGKVLAFEPTPGTYKVLLSTLRLNKSSNVIALEAAVGEVEGKATFYISEMYDGCNDNSLVKDQKRSNAKGYEINVSTIDNI